MGLLSKLFGKKKQGQMLKFVSKKETIGPSLWVIASYRDKVRKAIEKSIITFAKKCRAKQSKQELASDILYDVACIDKNTLTWFFNAQPGDDREITIKSKIRLKRNNAEFSISSIQLTRKYDRYCNPKMYGTITFQTHKGLEKKEMFFV